MFYNIKFDREICFVNLQKKKKYKLQKSDAKG